MSIVVVVGVGVVVPPDADAGECAICYGEYLVGGATSVTPLCGHMFHRRCLEPSTAGRP
jgi:energy-converting hydrogenase Eha subunit B